MTPEEIASRQDEITARLKELDTEFAGKQMPDEEREEFKSLFEERKSLDDLADELETRRQIVEDAAKNPEAREAGFQVRTERVRGDDIYDLSTVRAAVNSPEQAARELKERAKYAIEQGSFEASSIDADKARENAERLLSKDQSGSLARRYLETGSPAYERAFGKTIVGQPLTDTETRALSTTDNAGGYNIPFTLDPSIIHTSAQSVNPFRAISRVVQVTTDNWQGVTSAGVTAGYAQEASEADDDSPSFGQPSIHPERADCFIPYSIELGQDWSGLVSELTLMVQEAKDDLEATKFGLGPVPARTSPRAS